MYLHVDGSDDRNGTASCTDAVANQPFLIASRPGGIAPWFGDIAEVGVWSKWLSDGEIVALAKGFRPSLIAPSSLLFYNDLLRDLRPIKGEPFTTTGGSPTVSVHPRRIG
jgi:hypothetical protein